MVTLIVDGEEGPKEVGSAKVTAADTNDPLYIGGVPSKCLTLLFSVTAFM